MTKQDIIDYVMTTPHNTNRAVLSGMLNQLTEGGGGGSSDFSTAQVTVISNAEVTVQTSYAANNSEDIEGGCASMPWINSLFIEEPLTVILYKGHAQFELDGGFLSAEGDATIISDTIADITGDCTITINS